MKQIIRQLFKRMHIFILILILAITFVKLELIIPDLEQKFIDDVIIDGKTSEVKYILELLLLSAFLVFVIGFIRNYLSKKTSIHIIGDIRKELVEKINNAKIENINLSSGELFSIVRDDTEKLNSFLSDGLIAIIMSIYYILFGIASILMKNINLGIMMMILSPILFFVTYQYNSKLTKERKDAQNNRVKMNQVACEFFSGIKLIKSLWRRDFEFQKFQKFNNDYCEDYRRIAKLCSVYETLLSTTIGLIEFCIISYGGYLTLKEQISVGELFAVYTLVVIILGPIQSLVNQLAETLEARVLIDNLKKIYNLTSENYKYIEGNIFFENNESGENDTNIEKELFLDHIDLIEFRNVTLEKDGRKLLDNVSFKISKGETLGIIGSIGSGKTQIFEILERFKIETNGKILINGLDISRYNIKSIRDNIAYVMQKSELFSSSIDENISLVAKSLDDDEKKRIYNASCVTSIVEKNKGKECEDVGESGSKMSGGEKSRISLAMALASRKEVLLLDDVTAALDTITEKKIIDNIERINGNIKIIVSHKITALKNATKIMMIENGKVVDIGTHESFMSGQNKYREIYERQMEI